MTVIRQFPLDLTAKSARNLVRNEERTFAAYNDRIFVPSGGCFYTETLVVFDKDTGRRLQPNVDYKCLHLNTDASIDSGKQVCTIIVVENQTVGKVKYDYQAIGGHYSDTIPVLKDMMNGVDFNSLTKISWGTQIYGKPETFPAAAHVHPGHEFGSWNRFHVALNNIYHALMYKDTAAWSSILDYLNHRINEVTSKPDLSNYHTREQVSSLISEAIIASNLNYYTKTESDSRFIRSLANYYTRGEVDTLVNTNITNVTNRVVSLEQASTNTTSSLNNVNNRLVTIESKNSSQDSSISNLNSSVGAINTRLGNADSRIAAIEGVNQSQATAINGLDTRLDNVEAKNTTQDRTLTELDGRADTLEATAGGHTTEINKLKAVKHLTVSTDSGNLIENRANGIYYGIEAPPNLSNLYVDAIGGLDTNPGSKEAPLKTLDKALSMIDSDVSNTIHLKTIPADREHEVCYYISKRYFVTGGATRTIKIYDDPWYDGAKWTEFYNATNRLTRNYESGHVRRPAILMKKYRTTHGTETRYCLGGFCLETVTSSILLECVEFFTDVLADGEVAHPYTEYGSLIYGNGKLTMLNVGFFKTCGGVDVTNWTCDRPADVTNSFYNPKYNIGWLMFNNRNVSLRVDARSTMVGYAGNMDGNRLLTGKPKKATIFHESQPEFANTPLDIRSINESFVMLHDTPTCYIFCMDVWKTGNWTLYTGTPANRAPACNFVYLLANTNLVWDVKWNNGVSTNFSSNKPIYNSDPSADVLNDIRLSIYSQKYKPGDLYETTRPIVNEAQLIEEMGYGQWRRYGNGYVTVGVLDSGDRMRRVGAFMGKHYHTLTEQQMPRHNHTTHDVFNRFVGMANHVINHGFTTERNTSTGSTDDDRIETEIAIANFNKAGLDNSLAQPRGEGWPFPLFQPSVLVERWRRVVSLTDPACYGGAIITLNNISDLTRHGNERYVNFNLVQSSPSTAEKLVTVTGHRVPPAGTGGATPITTWTNADWERLYHGDHRWPSFQVAGKWASHVDIWEQIIYVDFASGYQNKASSLVWYLFGDDHYGDDSSRNFRPVEWVTKNSRLKLVVTIREFYTLDAGKRLPHSIQGSGVWWLGAYNKG